MTKRSRIDLVSYDSLPEKPERDVEMMDVACIDDNDSELFSSLGERLHAAFVSTLGDKLPAYTNRPFAPNLGDKLPTFTNRQSPVDADCEVERTQVRRSRWDDLDAHRQSPVKHVRKSSVKIGRAHV